MLRSSMMGARMSTGGLVGVLLAAGCAASPAPAGPSTGAPSAPTNEPPPRPAEPPAAFPSAQVATLAVDDYALPVGLARAADGWTLVLRLDSADALRAVTARGGAMRAVPGDMSIGEATVVGIVGGEPPGVVAHRERDGRGGDLVIAGWSGALPDAGQAIVARPWVRTDHVPWFAELRRGYVAWIEHESRPMTRAEQVACSRHGSCSGSVLLRSRWVVGVVDGTSLTQVPLAWSPGGSLSWIHGALDASGDLWLGYSERGIRVVHVAGGAAREVGGPLASGGGFVGLLHDGAGPVVVTDVLSQAPAGAEVVLTLLDAEGGRRGEARAQVAGNATGAIHALACGGSSWVVMAPMMGARHEVHALAFGGDAKLRGRAVVHAAEEPGLAATGSSRASREPVFACGGERLAYAFVVPQEQGGGTAVLVEWSSRVPSG